MHFIASGFFIAFLSTQYFFRLFNVGKALIPEISIIKFSVMPTLGQQAIVTAFFDDGAFLHDDDSICGLHGGETMRDEDAGGIFQN